MKIVRVIPHSLSFSLAAFKRFLNLMLGLPLWLLNACFDLGLFPRQHRTCFHGSSGWLSSGERFPPHALLPPLSHMEGAAQLGAYPKEITAAFFFLFVTRPFKQGSHKVQSCILQKNPLLPLSDSLSFRAQTSISSFFSLHLFSVLKGRGRSQGERRETMTNAAKSRASNLAKGL